MKRLGIVAMLVLLVFSGIQFAPCFLLKNSHECCQNLLQQSLANPFTACCREETSTHPKVDLSKILNDSVFSLALGDFNVEKYFLNFTATRIHLLGPAPPNIPIYLSNLTLLL